MGKHDSLKMQTFVLKVDIKCVCDGCKEKVKRLIQKTEGVYSTSVDAEQGKVVVSGVVDPDTLVKKLKKSGKHAELWGGQKANFAPANQFNGLGNGKGGKDPWPQQHKGGQGQHKGGHFKPVQLKGAKDLKMPFKDQKSVTFTLPEEDEFDASEDDFDGSEDYDDDDECEEDLDDEDGEFGHGHHNSSSGNKKMPMVGNGHVSKGGPSAGMIVGHGHPMMNASKTGGGKDAVVSFQKGEAIDLPFEIKGNGGKPYGKNGGGGKKGGSDSYGGGWENTKGGKEKGNGGGGGKNGGAKKSGGGLLVLLGFGGKKSKKSEAGTKKNKGNGVEAGAGRAGNHKGKQGGKYGGGDFDDYPEIEIDATSHAVKVGGKVGQMGPSPSPAQLGMMNDYPMGHQTGKMDNFPMDRVRDFSAVHGQEAHAAINMNGGYNSYQGQAMRPPPPPSFQHYMPPMMMNPLQQHYQQPANGNGNGLYQPTNMMYARPHPSMNYMPPPPMPSHPMNDHDPMTHIFSDENTESCSVM